MSDISQQILAVDARYNVVRGLSSPQFRTLYIRRRSQLLRENAANEDPVLRRQYLRLRTHLLQQKYGLSVDLTSLKSRSHSTRSDRTTFDNESDVSRSQSRLDLGGSFGGGSGGGGGGYGDDGLVPTRDAEASRALVGGKTIAENYAFSGFLCIFDQHSKAVTKVKFANDDGSRLACSSLDSTLSICNILESSPSSGVERLLEGHSGGVNDFEWSLNNDLIVSCSEDGTLKIWNSVSGVCIRTLADCSSVNSSGGGGGGGKGGGGGVVSGGSGSILSCAFHPLNNNIIVYGNARGLIQVVNVSTGIHPKGGCVKIGGEVGAITFDASGLLLWVGSDAGCVVSLLFDLASCRLSVARRLSVDGIVSSLNCRSWVSREARDPQILASTGNNSLLLLRVVDAEGSLQLRRKFFVKHKTNRIRSSFCPIISFRQGACVVSGSEDGCVYLFNVEAASSSSSPGSTAAAAGRQQSSSSCLNRLQGHSAPVLSVNFNYDESLLASSDAQGLVIIWRRERNTK